MTTWGSFQQLSKSAYAFSPVLVAQGTLLASLIATRVLYGGEKLFSFKKQAVGFVGFFLMFVLGSLAMFTPQLSRAKRRGLADYGLLANR